jgi:hypothetical protein
MPGRRRAQRELPALTRAVSDAVTAATATADPAGAECQKLLILLRERCPGLVPTAPLPPGQVGPEIPLEQEAGTAMVRLVARQISGLPPAQPGEQEIVVWTHGNDELAVLADQVSVTTAPGALAVDVPVLCDQAGQVTVRVRFALGSDDRPAGLVCTTDERPFGPAAVVDVWGEALTAFAWQIVLTTAAKLADATGRDVDGAGLIPVGLRAGETGIAVLTMARHSFDRTGVA